MSKSGIPWILNQDGTPGQNWEVCSGCTKCSPGCDHCWAVSLVNRFAHNPIFDHRYEGLVEKTENGLNWTGRIHFFEDRLLQPLNTKKPTTYGVSLRSDLFHPSVSDEFIAKVWAAMWNCGPSSWILDNPLASLDECHTFIVLTKRAERMHTLLTSRAFIQKVEELTCTSWPDGAPIFPNIWLGVTCCNQAEADRNIPMLLQTPAAVRFVSLEPLLERINLETPADKINGGGWMIDDLDWVIVGGESGVGARPMHPQWVRDLRDQCVGAGVPFWFKQWGEWCPQDQTPILLDRVKYAKALDINGKINIAGPKSVLMWRLGTKIAGKFLDHKTWEQMPGVKHG